MITPSYNSTATERVLPRLAIDFTTAITDARVVTTRSGNTATRFNASGNIEIVNANLPRYDFDPTTNVCKGQLIEEARTNLLLNSLINGSNLTTQSVTLSAIAYTLSFYGTGSVAISGGHSATVTGAGAFPTRKTYAFTPTAGSTTFTVSGTVSYAQLEAGAFATSFIPTAGTSVLRNSDGVSMTGTNFSSWYNASEGTFVAYVSSLGAYSFYSLLDANDGSTLNRIGIRYNSASVSSGIIVANNVQQGPVNPGAPNASASRFALAYKENSFAASYRGSAVVTDTSGTVPTVSRLDIGNVLDSPNTQLNGWVLQVLYYPLRLTNNEVQAFSK